MSIESINSASQVSFSSGKTIEAKTETKAQQPIGDKKKLALALAGLAAAGIAAVGIAMNIKKGKIPTELSFDDFKKIGKFDKGQALVKGIPYTGTIEVVNKKGKFNLEYVDGVLKSSTKHKETPEGLVDYMKRNGVDTNLVDIEYIPSIRKTYSETAGKTKKITVEKIGVPRPGDKKLYWRPFKEVFIEDGKVATSYDATHKVYSVRQPDGSWSKIGTMEQIDKDRNIHFITKNLKTDEIISDEITGKYTPVVSGDTSHSYSAEEAQLWDW